MVRVVRFMLDYGHDWPLWENGTEKYAMEPQDYGLSPELTERLRGVYTLWETHFDPFDGWDDEAHRREWADQARQASAVLRREVSHFADVKDESHWDQ